MELEVGMYARTINGKILKINRYDEQPNNPLWMTVNSGIMSKGSISKASYDIIDLIEVGDYVNGHIVEDLDNLGYLDLDSDTIKYDDIKSIVTKEQFESMKYEV